MYLFPTRSWLHLKDVPVSSVHTVHRSKCFIKSSNYCDIIKVNVYLQIMVKLSIIQWIVICWLWFTVNDGEASILSRIFFYYGRNAFKNLFEDGVCHPVFIVIYKTVLSLTNSSKKIQFLKRNVNWYQKYCWQN